MAQYEIIETDDGLAVVELEPGARPEDVAVRYEGVVVDPGPFASYEEACDAIVALQQEESDEWGFPV